MLPFLSTKPYGTLTGAPILSPAAVLFVRMLLHPDGPIGRARPRAFVRARPPHESRLTTTSIEHGSRAAIGGSAGPEGFGKRDTAEGENELRRIRPAG